LRRLQDPSKIIGDNSNNISREASRHFRNKKREYLRDKINELAMYSKNNIDLHRGINEFKKAYKHRANLVKDEISDLFAYSHNFLNMSKNSLRC
jgi:hypothetical protein